jgi:hypothetical protein
MSKKIIYLIVISVIVAIVHSVHAENQTDNTKGEPFLIPTFHCLSVYWSPSEGGTNHQVLVKYREVGSKIWKNALSLRYLPIDTPECKADYRGSIVDLTPATKYDVVLTLEGTEQRAECRGITWSETFPVKSITKVSDRATTLKIDQSGTFDAYVVYDGSDCTIDALNKESVGISVQASYVILRGFTIKNVKEHGIRIFSGNHIVIEDCDISKWGSESENGWGKNYQACVYSNYKSLSSVIIQRCKMHHPTWDTNSWAEKHHESTHPRGPQTIAFWESEGNHVIRYNECWSDKDHYFNDGMGAGSNGGYRGFPGADSDIYCNYIANCWDDGIEAEGGDQNVRIWNNYIEDVLIPIANAADSIGPLYIWRNISGRSYSSPGSSWNMTHGPFIKMGYAGGEKWMTGHMYVFNNTIFQDNNDGANGLGGNSRIIKHCTSKNNILQVRTNERCSIAIHKNHADNDFDYDLTSADFPENHQQNGFKGVPEYVQGAGFDFDNKTGMFQLAPKSLGVDAAVVIPNFCEVTNGNLPDIGAHELGTDKIQFGVKALFVPFD